MSIPPNRLAAFVCALFGLGVLCVFVAFNLLPAFTAAGECATTTSLVEFQQARTMEDLVRQFSAPGGACRGPLIAAMNAQNELDLYAFIPIYAVFLISGAWMMAGRVRAPIFWIALAAVIVALIGDALETYTQLRITTNIEAARPLLGPLAFGYAMKYAGLAAHAAVIGFIAIALRRSHWPLGAFALLAALVTIANLVGAHVPMLLAYPPFWMALLVTSVLVARRKQA